jgi:hypothetical protein
VLVDYQQVEKLTTVFFVPKRAQITGICARRVARKCWFYIKVLGDFAPGLVTTGWLRVEGGKWLFLLGSWTLELEFPI